MPSSLCPACLTPDASPTACPRCGWRAGQSPSDPLYLPPGTRLNPPYQVAQVLGYGGFGITYLGWDANLEIKVAIKEYLPRALATRHPQSREVLINTDAARQQFALGLTRFLDEARTLAKFQQHPGIVSVLAFFRAHGTGYMVMEYVEGLTLKSYLQQGPGRLNWPQTLAIFMQVMDALRSVHHTGLLHRDIAPDNIYLCKDGRIKLLDFGAARETLDHNSQPPAVTVKPGFAPEEQYREQGEQGPWSDVYSVAASIYYCLTGQAPPDALQRLAHDDLLPPSQYGVCLPSAAEQALLKALALRVFQRTSSIETLQQQLSPLPSNALSAAVKDRLGAISASTTLSEPLIASKAFHGTRWLWFVLLSVALLVLAYQQVRHRPTIPPTPITTTPQAELPAQPLPKTADLEEEVLDWSRQRQLERQSADELKHQQAAALQRFESRNHAEQPIPAASQKMDNSDPRHAEHLRNLCEEWGATMNCEKQ